MLNWIFGRSSSFGPPQASGSKKREPADLCDGASSSASPEDPKAKRTRKEVIQVNDSLDRPSQQSGSPKMQILFFHGIPSSDFCDVHLTTWCHRDGFLWPQDWLPEKYPGIHVFFVKYNASLVNENFRMNNIGENLVSDLLHANIGQVHGCPVVLVGHCIGGLVIKELCLKAHQEFHSTDFMDGRAKALVAFLHNVRGVFFYSTPHHGIREISRASHLLRSPLFKFFQTLSTATAVLNSDFAKLCKIYSKWKIQGVGESLCVQSGVFRNVLVVEEASAREGVEIFTTLSEDHFSVCKPKGQRSGGFYHLTNLLDDIAKEEIRSQENPENLQYLPDSIVGIEIPVQEVKDKLEEVSILGLTGMGGSGKSTLASAIFNDLCCEFEYTCFVRNVKSIRGEIDTLMREVWKYMHRNGRKVEGEMKWSHLRGKRLLLILDDISDWRDIQALSEIAQGPSQSCLIATSRESDLFDTFYEVPLLDENNAKQLFISFAFPNNETVPSKLANLVKEIVKKCDGLPLTLEVLGKWLKKTKDLEEWKQTLDALGKAESVTNFNERLWAKLRPSIDSLEENERQMFLDVVTFFDDDGRHHSYEHYYSLNWTLRDAQAAWRETYGVSEKLLWRTLVERSLVYDVKEDQALKVHEQLRSLGKKMAGECYKCKRVLEISSAMKVLLSTNEVDKKDIHALELVGSYDDIKEMDALQSIVAEANYVEANIFVDEVVRVPSLGLKNLEKLRYLDVDSVSIDGGATTNWCPSSVVALRCVGMNALDLGHQRRLVVLKISDPDLIFLPNSIGQLSALRILILECASLRSIPEEMANLSKLEVLQIYDSPDFQNLPETLGQLVQLKILHLGLLGLDALPESFGLLSALERLTISMFELKTLPISFGRLSSLTYLRISFCHKLESLPESFGLLPELTDLTFYRCNGLKSIPETFSHLSALRRLEFDTCTGLRSLPESLGKLPILSRLKIRKCLHLQSLPESLHQLGQLEYLELSDCRNLDSLPFSFAKIISLRHLIIKGLCSLKSIPDHYIQNLPSLRTLELGELPYVKELPAWLVKIGVDNLAWSLNLFRVEDRHVSLSRDEPSTGRFELVGDIHEAAMEKLQALDYEGALAILEISSPGIPKLDGFLLQEKGILKRKMGDYNGALEDLTAALECFSKEDDGQHHAYDCWKHRGYVKYLMEDMEGAEEDGTMALQLQIVYRRSVVRRGSRRPVSWSLGEESVQYMHFGLEGRQEMDEHDKLMWSSHSKAIEQVDASDFQGALASFSVINVRLLTLNRAFFLQERGILKRLAGDLGGAMEDLTAALETSGDDYECLKHRSYVMFLLGDLDGARMDAEKCLTLKSPAYLGEGKFDSLGWTPVAFLDFNLK